MVRFPWSAMWLHKLSLIFECPDMREEQDHWIVKNLSMRENLVKIENHILEQLIVQYEIF